MIHGKPDEESSKILWTGGWDSTFQLLRLLFLQKLPVQPYYLIDEVRGSTGAELLAMKRIRAQIRELDQSAAALIHPTNFFSASEIPKYPEIANAFSSIKKQNFIGSQYDWLARFCEYQGIAGLQLCIHEDDKAAFAIRRMIDKSGVKEVSPRIGDQYSETDEYVLFKYFEFPILDLTKVNMAQIAKDRGWSQIMEMTWFCHTPKNGRPCGRCSPCKYTIEEGLAWRIPTHRRLLYEFYLSFPRSAKQSAAKTLSFLRKKS